MFAAAGEVGLIRHAGQAEVDETKHVKSSSEKRCGNNLSFARGFLRPMRGRYIIFNRACIVFRRVCRTQLLLRFVPGGFAG